MLRDRD